MVNKCWLPPRPSLVLLASDVDTDDDCGHSLLSNTKLPSACQVLTLICQYATLVCFHGVLIREKHYT